MSHIRTMFFAALLVCAATLASSPALALAVDGTYETTYYSDSTMTVEVGWQKRGYCGSNYDRGVHTSYWTQEISYCPRP